ncbi:MAG: hypothetical protein MUO68_09350, partial [Desulfobacteraceae bacterium]|nr:hypothetical protein [Desulfobacteraceae bacterium]
MGQAQIIADYHNGQTGSKKISRKGAHMNIFALIRRWVEVPFRFRTLFWGFVSKEIRGRFAGSIGGFAWSLLTPLANLLIYIFVFSVVLKIRLKPMETGTDSFAIFFLAGMLPWLAFSEALSNAID